MYGIDLEARTVGAKRFLALACRLPAYDGAMTAALAAHHPPPDPDAPQEVSTDAMNMLIPGLIERVEV